MSDTVKYVLDESRLPEAWYNLAADLPEPPPPVLHPGTGQPVGPDDLAPLFPMEIILQEVSTDRFIAIPEEVRDGLSAVAADAALPRPPAGEGARDAGAHLLQVRGRLPDRLAQAEHRGPAGLLQQAGGRHAAHDRDRRGPVGLGARVRGRALRPRGRGLHGQGLVRPEAVPARADGDVRRARASRARPRRRTPAARSSPSTPTRPAASASRSPRRSRWRRTREDTKYALGSVLNHVLMHQTVIGEEAHEAARDGGRLPGRRRSAAPAAARTSPGIAFPFIGRALRGGARCA